jgi:hypothetical protein
MGIPVVAGAIAVARRFRTLYAISKTPMAIRPKMAPIMVLISVSLELCSRTASPADYLTT